MKNNAARKLKQVPSGYLLVGVDPHKRKHAAVVITQDLMVQSKFKFANSRRGFEETLERVRSEMKRTSCRGIMFAIETAGHYWRNLAYFLDERGVPFHVINQFALKRRREGMNLNRSKNDYRDAEVAAKLLCNGEFTETKLPQGVYAELRASYNAYRRLVKERTRITNLLQGLLDGLFPEFTQVFKDPLGQTALSVLSTCPIPKTIAGMAEEEFVSTIRARHQGRLMRKKLRALHYAARTSIGIEAGAQSVSHEVSFLIGKLQLIKWQVRKIEGVLTRLVDETEEGKYLLSIRGLNYIAAAGMLAELGSFKSYRNARQLIKMAGSNPIESESAGKRATRTPMSKKGRPGLRYCTWTAVIPLLRHNPDFRSWAKRLRERPVHANPLNGKEIVGATLNRLLRLAFTLVKKQTFYRLPQLVEVTN
ncbi:MAG: IS110 family transposase [Desulfobacterales bacterium]|nr:IS110 family transposase [Desulfobacterales bacterium]